MANLCAKLLLALCVIGIWPHTALAQLACKITQITRTISPTADSGSAFPAINADGTRIAFHSERDLTGENRDFNEEIFLFDTITSTFTQITQTTGSPSFEPSINASGTRIAFRSSANLTGGNADFNFEIFLFDTRAGTFNQITQTTGIFGNLGPSINADGTRIAVQSDSDPTGQDPDPLQDVEIFLFDATAGTLTQVTRITRGRSFSPSINAQGTRVFSSASDLTGENADLNFEIFLAECAHNKRRWR
jgi:Tol biopolymer transport system component